MKVGRCRFGSFSWNGQNCFGLEMKGFVNQCATAKKKGPAEIARPFVDGFVLS
jgi:hypothetical protein